MTAQDRYHVADAMQVKQAADNKLRCHTALEASNDALTRAREDFTVKLEAFRRSETQLEEAIDAYQDAERKGRLQEVAGHLLAIERDGLVEIES